MVGQESHLQKGKDTETNGFQTVHPSIIVGLDLLVALLMERMNQSWEKRQFDLIFFTAFPSTDITPSWQGIADGTEMGRRLISFSFSHLDYREESFKGLTQVSPFISLLAEKTDPEGQMPVNWK